MDAPALTLKPERFAQLEAYAQRHGKDATAALDDALADYFETDQREYNETVLGIRKGIEDMEAGRVIDEDQFFEALRVENGFPG